MARLAIHEMPVISPKTPLPITIMTKELVDPSTTVSVLPSVCLSILSLNSPCGGPDLPGVDGGSAQIYAEASFCGRVSKDGLNEMQVVLRCILATCAEN